jgi:hypothetical protein
VTRQCKPELSTARHASHPPARSTAANNTVATRVGRGSAGVPRNGDDRLRQGRSHQGADLAASATPDRSQLGRRAGCTFAELRCREGTLTEIACAQRSKNGPAFRGRRGRETDMDGLGPRAKKYRAHFVRALRLCASKATMIRRRTVAETPTGISARDFCPGFLPGFLPASAAATLPPQRCGKGRAEASPLAPPALHSNCDQPEQRDRRCVSAVCLVAWRRWFGDLAVPGRPTPCPRSSLPGLSPGPTIVAEIRPIRHLRL